MHKNIWKREKSEKAETRIFLGPRQTLNTDSFSTHSRRLLIDLLTLDQPPLPSPPSYRHDDRHPHTSQALGLASQLNLD